MQPPPLTAATGKRNCGRWLRCLLALVTITTALLGWSFSGGELYSASVFGLSGGAYHIFYFGFGPVPYDAGGNIPMPAGTNPFLPVVLVAAFYILFSLLVYGGFLLALASSIAATMERFAGVLPSRVTAGACALLAVATYFGTTWVLAHSGNPHVKGPPAKRYYLVFSGLFASSSIAYALLSRSQRIA